MHGEPFRQKEKMMADEITHACGTRGLVSIVKREPVTTTLAIAKRTHTDHENIIELVRKYQEDLEEFGVLDFKSGHQTGRTCRPTKYALLNEPQSTLLISYMRNTKTVRAFKIQLVKAFYVVTDELKSQSQQFKDFQTPSDAQRIAADLTDKTEDLLKEVEKVRPKLKSHDGVNLSQIKPNDVEYREGAGRRSDKKEQRGVDYEGYVSLKEIREDVFFGLSTQQLWRLRKHPKFPKAMGRSPLYFDKKKVIAWRNKYWNRNEMRK